jgi:hypothetical protein
MLDLPYKPGVRSSSLRPPTSIYKGLASDRESFFFYPEDFTPHYSPLIQTKTGQTVHRIDDRALNNNTSFT